MLAKHKSLINLLAAYSIHLLTASGGIVALISFYYMRENRPINALSFMALAILIDAVDGTLARALRVKKLLPNIDGCLLDNLIDFINYVFIPALFILEGYLETSKEQAWIFSILIILCSAFQFSQKDAKTKDNFFKGFPSYWNIVVMYLYVFNATELINCLVLSGLCILIFIPIKYIYPSRLSFLSHSTVVKNSMRIGVILFGVTTMALLWCFPNTPVGLSFYAFIFITFYLLLSLYRTLRPLRQQTPDS